jgi:hypothetical protein
VCPWSTRTHRFRKAEEISPGNPSVSREESERRHVHCGGTEPRAFTIRSERSLRARATTSNLLRGSAESDSGRHNRFRQ